jgi:glycosyltransferase involved in cell wall biosynthesis
MKQGKHQPAILALVPYYRPGYKGGGPIASLEALMGHLGGEFLWMIATADSDYGERVRYPNIPNDGRIEKDGLTILYLRPGLGRLFRLARLLRRGDYGLLYLNDMFSPTWGVWPLFLHRLGWLKGKPVLVAPRNQFSPGALGIKSLKKRVFLRVARWVGLWKGLCWQATCEEERQEILRNVGGGRVLVAPPFSSITVQVDGSEADPPQGGPLRIVFLSRISPKKNLDYALSVLGGISFPVQFDIAGPVDDVKYWEKVQALIVRLPREITVRHLGPVEPGEVQGLLASYHAMFLPTRGENFGHVILESLAAGCPPIISDRTPWKDLAEKGCGWVVPLEDANGFRQALTDLNAMAPEDRERMRAAARAYAMAYVENPEIKELNLKMFREVMGLV